MKKGFILISTLALIVILSLLILLISRTLYTDSLKTNVFSNSVEKRIELINIEKLLIVRKKLRSQVLQSPLFDIDLFVKNFIC